MPEWLLLSRSNPAKLSSTSKIQWYTLKSYSSWSFYNIFKKSHGNNTSHTCWSELLHGKSNFRVVIFFPYSAVVHFVVHLIYFYYVERYVIARYFFKGYIHDSSLMLKCILPLHWLSYAVLCLSELQGYKNVVPRKSSDMCLKSTMEAAWHLSGFIFMGSY